MICGELHKIEEPQQVDPCIINKFDLVLNGLSQQDYKVSNDFYFDMFITHLSGKSGEGEPFFINISQFIIIYTAKKGNKNYENRHKHIFANHGVSPNEIIVL